MYYLVDTNVFLHDIDSNIYGVAKLCKDLQKLIEKGILTREDIKKENFKKKDMGECELVAIAKASGGEYWLITNDKGRVYKHPDMNIFDAYSKDKDVVILSGEEWIRNIGYLSEDPQK
ncbi:MAG: hypothetical protein K1W41_22675 [Lachnospiraceae bacterium]